MSIERVDGGDYLPDPAPPEAGVAAGFATSVETEEGTGQTQKGGSAGARSLLDALKKPESQPTSAEHQETDRLAKQLVAAVRDKLPPHPSFKQVGSAITAVAEDPNFQKGHSHESLWAAFYLAIAKVNSRRRDLPEDRKDHYFDDIALYVANAAQQRGYGFTDQAKIARLLIDSADVHAVNAPRAVLTRALTELTLDDPKRAEKLDANTRTAIESIILSSGLARGSQRFLSGYRDALHHPRQPASVAAVLFDNVIADHGEAQQFPTDAALHNAIGRALRLGHERLPQTETDRKLADEGSWELFTGEQLERVSSIAKAIRAAGGADAKVTLLPFVFQDRSAESPAKTYHAFGVTDGKGIRKFVDGRGNVDTDIQTLLARVLDSAGPGTILYPKDGKLKVAPDGSVPMATYPTPVPLGRTT